jgi:SPX domain protein involved in polyphosphate accumulation
MLYTGLVKILKKYDKRTGALIRLPFIQRVLQQPFFTTDVLNKLVKECEGMLDHLFSWNDDPSGRPEAHNKEEGSDPKAATESKQTQLKVPKELAEIENMESMYMKLTLSALRVLKEIRSGSSTVSEFSLPPLQTNAMELS